MKIDITINCPYCGYKNVKSCEFDSWYSGKYLEVCENCVRDFVGESEISCKSKTFKITDTKQEKIEVKTTTNYRKVYRKLCNVLKKNNYEKSGTTAKVLLQSFMHKNGELRIETAVNEKLCKIQEFDKWRDRLIRDNWLSNKKADYPKNHAGFRLTRYLDQLKES